LINKFHEKKLHIIQKTSSMLSSQPRWRLFRIAGNERLFLLNNPPRRRFIAARVPRHRIGIRAAEWSIGIFSHRKRSEPRIKVIPPKSD